MLIVVKMTDHDGVMVLVEFWSWLSYGHVHHDDCHVDHVGKSWGFLAELLCETLVMIIMTTIMIIMTTIMIIMTSHAPSFVESLELECQKSHLLIVVKMTDHDGVLVLLEFWSWLSFGHVDHDDRHVDHDGKSWGSLAAV